MNYNEIYWNSIGKVIDANPYLLNLRCKKILITGATGLIGSSVVDILFYLNDRHNAQNKLILAGRNHCRMIKRYEEIMCESMDYEFLYYDATLNPKFNLEVDYIIHCAGNAHPEVYAKQPVETMLSNIGGLKCLLDLLISNPRGRLIFISSSEVYGNREKENGGYLEDEYGYINILNPRACYPNSKRAAETLCISYNQEYNTDTVIVRPGHIYGSAITEDDSRASAQFIRKALCKESIIMKSAGTQNRSYCHALDAASAILTILLYGKRGEAYNVSNPNEIITIRQMAEALAYVSGIDVCYEKPSEVEKQGYNLMSNSALNANKLVSLGWKACFDIREGSRITLECMK